jgi:hypothetical protein
VYDSKGLEFDDVNYLPHSSRSIDLMGSQVLLWNFFQDSTANSSQWRIVHGPPPEFDDVKHAGICSEVFFVCFVTFQPTYDVAS